MSTKKYKPTKKELLSELESIRASLSGDGTTSEYNQLPGSNNGMPKLLDSVLDNIEDVEFDTMIKDHENSLKKALPFSEEKSKTVNAKPSSNTSLSGQQSLFDNTKPKTNTPQEGYSEAFPNENPFLPKHIRDRLQQSKNSIIDELSLVGKTLNNTAKARQKPSDPEQIIEALVAKYIPIIEKELRARLLRKLETDDNLHKNS